MSAPISGKSSRLFRVARARGRARLSTRKPAPDWQPSWTVEESLAIGMSSTACCASRIASSFRPSPASSLATSAKYGCILGFVALLSLRFSRARLQTPPAPSAYHRAHAQPIRKPSSPSVNEIEGDIRQVRRSSGNHPIRRVVISQVKGGLKSCVPDPLARTKLQRHLL